MTFEDQNTNLNFLSAGTYEDISHFVFSYAEPIGVGDKVHLFFDNKLLYKNAIIFCKTDYLKYLFPFLKNSFNKYILITHHSDHSIDFSRFNEKAL